MASKDLEASAREQQSYSTFEEDIVFQDEFVTTINDPMSYTLGWLKSWQVFFTYKQTVWENPALWSLMGKLMVLAVVVAVATYNLMPDPQLLDASKFSAITSMVTMFTTLMLSFFLSLSVNRWIECVSGFLELFNAIRNLAMQLHTLGVDEDRIKDCLRYGVISSKFLIEELRELQMSEEKKKLSIAHMWRSMSHGKYGIRKNEREIVETLSDKAGQMWMWVGSLIGAMAADGEIPAMQTPTYGRIMDLAQAGQHGLRQVRTSVIVQMPFVYIHTLAVLVHLNTLLLAVNFGLASGVTIHGIHRYVHHYYYTVHPDPNVHMEPLTAQIQTLIIEVVKGICGPLLFQAFFEIAISVSSPFAEAKAAIPVHSLMQALQRDLDESFIMAEAVPWEKPRFKKVATPST